MNGLSPRDVIKSNEDMLWKKLYVDVMKSSVVKKKEQKRNIGRDSNSK